MIHWYFYKCLLLLILCNYSPLLLWPFLKNIKFKFNIIALSSFGFFLSLIVVLVGYAIPSADFLIPENSKEIQTIDLLKELYDSSGSDDDSEFRRNFQTALIIKSYDYLSNSNSWFFISFSVFAYAIAYLIMHKKKLLTTNDLKVGYVNLLFLSTVSFAVFSLVISSIASYHLIEVTFVYINDGYFVDSAYMATWLSHQFYFWLTTLLTIFALFIMYVFEIESSH